MLAGDAQGRDEYRAELERLIEARGLAGRVRIVGHCDDAPAALALADVAVIASTEPEAFGRTAIEAAAMGVPVVATALGADATRPCSRRPYVPAAERTGWLVPPGDAAALAAAIGEALRLSPAERGAARRARAPARPDASRPRRCRRRRSRSTTALSRTGHARRLLETIKRRGELTCSRNLPDSATLRWQPRLAPPMSIRQQQL